MPRLLFQGRRAGPISSHDPGGGDPVLPSAGDSDGREALHDGRRHVERRLHFRRAPRQEDPLPGPVSYSAARAGTSLCYTTTLLLRHSCCGHKDAKASEREPKRCLGQVFNFKLGCFAKCVQLHGLCKRGRVYQVSYC
jgi:hypothetical protein